MRTLKLFYGIAVSAVFFLIAFSSAQAADPVCGAVDKVLSSLEEKFNERTIEYGKTEAGPLITLLSSEGGKTWTILVVFPNGNACLLATGKGWKATNYNSESGA
jgi:hypothetical protein